VIGGPIGRTLTQRALMAEVTGIKLWIEYGIQSGLAQMCQAHHAAAPGDRVHDRDHALSGGRLHGGAGITGSQQSRGVGVTLDEAAVEKYRVKG